MGDIVDVMELGRGHLRENILQCQDYFVPDVAAKELHIALNAMAPARK
jgi:hypothetical protein